MNNPDIQNLKDIALYELSCIRSNQPEITQLYSTAGRRLKPWQYKKEEQTCQGASYELVRASLISVKRKIESTTDPSVFEQPVYNMVESFLITKCGFYGRKKNDRLKTEDFTVSSSIHEFSHLQYVDNRELLEIREERFHQLCLIVNPCPTTSQILWEFLHDSYDKELIAVELGLTPKAVQTKYDYLIRKLRKAAQEPATAKRIQNILTLA